MSLEEKYYHEPWTPWTSFLLVLAKTNRFRSIWFGHGKLRVFDCLPYLQVPAPFRWAFHGVLGKDLWSGLAEARLWNSCVPGLDFEHRLLKQLVDASGRLWNLQNAHHLNRSSQLGHFFHPFRLQVAISRCRKATSKSHMKSCGTAAECHPCFIQGTWEAPLAEVVPLVVPGWAAPALEAPEARITPALEALAPLGLVTCWPREAVEWHLLHLIFRGHLHHSPAYLVALVPFSCTFLDLFIHFIFSRPMTYGILCLFATSCKLQTPSLARQSHRVVPGA